MTAIAKKLEARLNFWKPDTVKEVERLVGEIIELADKDALDLVRVREPIPVQQSAQDGLSNSRHERTRQPAASSQSNWSQSLRAERDVRS